MSETLNRDYPLPEPANNVSDDVYRLRAMIEAVDADVAAIIMTLGDKAALVHDHEIDQIAGLTAVLSGKASVDHLHSLDDLSNVSGTGNASVGTILVKTADGWRAGNPASVLGQHGHTVAQIEGLVDALATKLDVSALPAALAGAVAKTTPVDADSLTLIDSAASNGLKRVTWARIKVVLKAFFDDTYAPQSHQHSADQTTSGVFNIARIPDLAMSKISGLVVALAGKQDSGNYEPARSAVSAAEAQAGTATTVRGWTAQRVAQAIVAQTPKITVSTGNPSGGSDGDVWFKV